ncbi:MAG: TorF family putative porin [Alphaproteobacteria bacterium]|nr:TorF family putative porin [Alphaproteobacteria bacterium]MCB9929288.1 hypothetical protein [Alphaproteobacteria bacterium]
MLVTRFAQTLGTLSAAATCLPLLVIAAGAAPALAEEAGPTIPGEFSANVALTTDYRFRGISQTDKNPAIQGGFDYSLAIADPISLYAGIWASNVDFQDGDQAQVEIDYYGGVTAEYMGVGIDVGLIYYTYPGASSGLDYDYFEGKIDLSYSPMDGLTLGAGLNYSPDYFASSGDFYYPHLSAEYTPELGLPLPLTLSATYGYNSIDDEAAFGTRSYHDWSAGIATSYKFITLKLQYIDNDLNGSIGDPTAVFTVSASF